MSEFQKHVIQPLKEFEGILNLPEPPLHPSRNPRFAKAFRLNPSPKLIFKHTSIPTSNEVSTLDPSESQFSSQSKHLRIKKPEAKHRVAQSVDFANKLFPIPAFEPKDDTETYRRRLNTPWKIEKVHSDDEIPCGILGRESIDRFYNHYKKLDKIKDINHFNAIKDSVYTSFLTKSESLNLLPAKVGVLKEAGESTKLKISNFRLGDKYAEVVSEGLKSVHSFKKLEMANNRLTPKGADVLLPRLTYNVELLDLSGNNIGKIGCEHISIILNSKTSKMVELNLEGNKLGDYALMSLLEALESNTTLKKLNISKNFISDIGAEKIGRMLDYNNTLEELYVRWNLIKGAGGIAILNGLNHCQSLKVLDLSWNSLGMHQSGFAKAFAEYIRSNQSLVHLDMSNNYLGKEDTKIIAEALAQNHTLYGLHYQGNAGYVDSKGFLQVTEDVETTVSGQHLLVPIKGVQMNHDCVKRYAGNFWEFKDVCWICEGWSPHSFQWNENEGPKEEPIYVHLSFEAYKAKYLPKKDNFQITRMIPPAPFTYFFTIEGFQMIDQNQPSEEPADPIIHYTIEGRNETTQLERVNYQEPKAPCLVIDPKTYDPLVELKPRMPDETYIPPEVRNERPTWIFSMGIFKDYRSDNEDLLSKCFAADFENNRISKLVKNPDELEEIKKLFRAIYKPLKECYRYYSAVGAISEVWSIPLNAYTEFCTKSGIIDSKLLSTSDFDRIFIATYTKSDKTKNPRNPDRALVRHQFMEGIFRMADQKYVSTGVVTSQKEAVKIMLDEIYPFISSFDNHKWRVERYWNEPVDTVLKSYLPIFRGVYKKYSGLKTLPGQRPFMCLEEFQKLVGDAGMYSDKCGERDALLSYNYAMMTQVDELNSDRIFQMSFLEFLEAISRIIDLASPAPYGESDSNIPYETRKNEHLSVKLEGAIPTLFFNCCGNDVKDVWVLPETSIFNMEEVIGKQRSVTKKRKIVRLNPTHPSSHNAYD